MTRQARPRPRLKSLDEHVHPRDDELDMELLDYEPLNVSRGSSILDDTDSELKVINNQRGPCKVNTISLNALLTLCRHTDIDSCIITVSKKLTG